MFAEALTVRILADSSGLRTELEATLGLLDRFRDSFSAIADVGQQLAQGFGALSQAVPPLQQISKLLTGIQLQIQSIGQTPLTINVAPALAALQLLAAAIEAVAARMNALSRSGKGAAGDSPAAALGGQGSPAAGVSPIAATASSPSAFPAMAAPRSQPALIPISAASPSALTPPATIPAPNQVSGESRERSEHDRPWAALNPRPVADRQETHPTERSERSAARSESSTVHNNHFGGINISVRETADVTALIRDLRLQGIHLRHRRG